MAEMNPSGNRLKYDDKYTYGQHEKYEHQYIGNSFFPDLIFSRDLHSFILIDSVVQIYKGLSTGSVSF